MPPRDPPDVSIGKEGPCKLPVRNRPPDDGGSRRLIATIKVVHAAYYSHVRIRSRAGETPRFPSSSFLSPPPYFLIRGDRLGETDLFLACFFALVLPPFVSSRGLFFLLRRDVGRSFGRYLSGKDGGILCCSKTTFGEGRLLGRVSKLSGFALIDSFLEVWQKRRRP